MDYGNRDRYHRLTRAPVEDNFRRKLGHFYFLFATYLAAWLAQPGGTSTLLLVLSYGGFSPLRPEFSMVKRHLLHPHTL